MSPRWAVIALTTMKARPSARPYRAATTSARRAPAARPATTTPAVAPASTSGFVYENARIANDPKYRLAAAALASWSGPGRGE